MNWIKALAEWWYIDPKTGEPDDVPGWFKFFVFVVGLWALLCIVWISWISKGVIPLVVISLLVAYYAFSTFLKSHLDK